jgi:molybdopterin synthase sulfur carrier subunit
LLLREESDVSKDRVDEKLQSITITVKLFAAYQEAYGIPELELQVTAGTPVEAVRDRLIQEHPELEQWRNLTRFGVNLQFVEPNTVLQDGDEVVLIPPVSGG